MKSIEELIIDFQFAQQKVRGLPPAKLQMRRALDLKRAALYAQAALSLAFAQLAMASMPGGNPVIEHYVKLLTPFFDAQSWYNPTVAMDIEVPSADDACVRVVTCLEQAIASYERLHDRLTMEES